MNLADHSTPLLQKRTEKFLAAVDWTATQMGLDVPSILDLDYLRSLPLGTFGRAWADHLDHHHLQPFDHGPRRKQLHDGVHVLTGYDTDPLGEAEVQAFLLGSQFRVANLVLLGGLMRGVQRQRRQGDLSISAEQVRSRFYSAYQRGQRSHFPPDTWQPEQLWELPLTTVQAHFGITP